MIEPYGIGQCRGKLSESSEYGGNPSREGTPTPNATPIFLGDWWPGRELNPRHADFQSAALPTELPGRTEPRIKQAREHVVN
jgi:hypothetical protein